MLLVTVCMYFFIVNNSVIVDVSVTDLEMSFEYGVDWSVYQSLTWIKHLQVSQESLPKTPKDELRNILGAYFVSHNFYNS